MEHLLCAARGEYAKLEKPLTGTETVGLVMRNPRSIDLHIDELVLHGFAPGDRYAIAEAVERELARLFAKGDMPAAFVDRVEITRMDAGAFNVVRGSDAETIGGQVAHAVYGRLSR